MSEYWVSKNKYFCKYCDIYIADDAPSRRQHENGLRHQGNRDRFVRGLYKEGERRKKDLAEEKREMARIEASANASFARDVHSGLATSASSSVPAPASTPTSTKIVKPTSKWSNYSTAQSLGYIDPDEEQMKAELERKRTQGLAGAWEVVAPPPPPIPTSSKEEPQPIKHADEADEENPCSSVQKREVEEDPEDARDFKFRKRKMEVGLGELWDPGDISIKVKKRSVPPQEVEIASNRTKHEDAEIPETTLGNSVMREAIVIANETHKTAGKWKKATVTVDSTRDVYYDPVQPKDEPSDPVKRERFPLPSALTKDTIAQPTPSIKQDLDSIDPLQITTKVSASSEGMFRKRKVRPTGRASGSARR